MKKAFVFLICLCASVQIFAFDRIIPSHKLPKKAQAFIAASFPGSMVTYAEMDDFEYNVTLNDGSEIQFSLLGNWKEIKSYKGIPPTALPQASAAHLATSFPNVPIVKVDKDDGYIKTQLANGMEIYFHKKSGYVVGQKWDD